MALTRAQIDVQLAMLDGVRAAFNDRIADPFNAAARELVANWSPELRALFESIDAAAVKINTVGQAILAARVQLEAMLPAQPPAPPSPKAAVVVRFGDATASLASAVRHEPAFDLGHEVYRADFGPGHVAWFERGGDFVHAFLETARDEIVAEEMELLLEGRGVAAHQVAFARGQAACFWPRRADGSEWLPTSGLRHQLPFPPYKSKAAAALIAQYEAMTFAPLAQGAYPTGMGSGGYHRSIGPLPQWDVVEMQHPESEGATRAMMIQGLNFGRYGLRTRDPATRELLKFAEHPFLSFDASTKNQVLPKTPGAPHWGIPHHPAPPYRAFARTGLWFFRESCLAAANFNHFNQVDWVRGYDMGALLTNAGSNTTRGAAWAIRSLLMAALVSPPGSQYRQVLANNVKYYYERYVAVNSNPLGVCIPYSDYGNFEKAFAHSMWMEDFLTGVFGFALFAMPDIPLLLDVFTWKARSVVGRFVETDPRDAAGYIKAVAPKAANWMTGDGPWFQTWAEAHMHEPAGSGEGLRGGNFPDGSSYWGNLMPALYWAAFHKMPGAIDAVRKVLSFSNYQQLVESMQWSPEWSTMPTSLEEFGEPPVAPAPPPAPQVPAPLPAPAVPAAIASLKRGEWTELQDTKIRGVLRPDAQSLGDVTSIVKAWNGGFVDTKRRRLMVWGAGHGDYRGSEMYGIDPAVPRAFRFTDGSPFDPLARDTPALPDNTPDDPSDDTPTARHTYDGLVYAPNVDRMFAFGGSTAPGGVGPTGTWSLDMESRRWRREPDGPTGLGLVTAYDPASGLIYVHDTYQLWRYDPRTGARAVISSKGIDYRSTGAIDPVRRKFVVVGDGVQTFDLDTGAYANPAMANLPRWDGWRQSPGIDFDPGRGQLVCWHGGSDVYAIDLDVHAWERIDVGAGPTADAPYQGTFGRWGYVPQFGVFLMVNSIDENGWAFRP